MYRAGTVMVTAVAAGRSQRFYFGVEIFNLHYPSSPPRILRFPDAPLELETRGLVHYMYYACMFYAYVCVCACVCVCVCI